MKIHLPKSRWQQHIQRREWHDWFAWYPVATWGRKLVWLETVRRKSASSYLNDSYWYEYITKE
jgi:hypothetical protein